MRSSVGKPPAAAVALLLAALGLGSCTARDRSDSAGGKPSSTAGVLLRPQGGPAGSPGAGQCECQGQSQGQGRAGEPECADRGPHGQCACGEQAESAARECGQRESATPVPDKVEERRDPAGHMVAHVGGELTDAPLLTVADAVSRAPELSGKLVRLEGNVSAMCHHERAWFAIVGNDQSGATLRVLTAPTFLVPPESIGKQVRVEGRLETIEVDAEKAKHLSDKHQLPAAGSAGQQTVMRATGAEFW